MDAYVLSSNNGMEGRLKNFCRVKYRVSLLLLYHMHNLFQNTFIKASLPY